MKVIGFTNKFYTLWFKGQPYKKYVNEYSWFWQTDYTYLKNISFNLEKAKQKMGDSEYQIDLNLRGTSSFSIASDNKKIYSDLEEWQMPYPYSGCGSDIRTMGNFKDGFGERQIKDLWKLYFTKDIWNNEIEEHSFRNLNPYLVRPVVYARRRLIELGLLERYKGAYYHPNYVKVLKEKEATEAAKNELKSGCHFNEKDRVELEIKEIEAFGFEGMYGYTHIITYSSRCGKLLKYMGGSPKDISSSEFVKVKATIKHDEYKGRKETKLQRISILK